MKKSKLLLCIATSLMISSCGPKSGFNSGDSSSTTTDGTNNGSSNPGNQSPSWDQVDMDGYPTSMDFAGQLVIQVDKKNQALLLILPIPSFVFLPFVSKLEIPEVEGAFFTSYKNSKGDKQLAISIPLKTVIKGAAFLPNQRLPNGDALPYVPAGELPGFAIAFPQNPNYRVYLYIGVNIAAAFVELPDISVPISGVFPVKNSSKTKEVGAIGYIAPKVNYNGGLFLAAQIPDRMAVIIDDLIRW